MKLKLVLYAAGLIMSLTTLSVALSSMPHAPLTMLEMACKRHKVIMYSVAIYRKENVPMENALRYVEVLASTLFPDMPADMLTDFIASFQKIVRIAYKAEHPIDPDAFASLSEQMCPKL